MNQLVVIAIGGAAGAIMRFLVSTGLYQWLGRDFPYGTLLVNVIGSFLIGLLSEALVLQRITIALDYRAAILVGFIGAFTTFSTFSLETFYLLEQGEIGKAGLNVSLSVSSCLVAVWIGLVCGRTLLLYNNGMVQVSVGSIPYGMIIINMIGALLIGIVVALLLQKISLDIEQPIVILVLLVGLYLTLSGLYLILFLIEFGYRFDQQPNFTFGLFFINSLLCSGSIALGVVIGKRIALFT